MEAMKIRGAHKCPRPGCDTRVPDRWFACPDDWRVLSPLTKHRIRSTSRLLLLDSERLRAIQSARSEWGQTG